ncbi:hypothetical protein HYALB_00003410 [Hymenoscyphus albidus]|uniref:DUF8004 domain-containing protein n=1 Tax=Hymenoscyphus albidus TaxID=595503 RepID=A0A9N9LFJ1_9HELO|nr:hypothetical protein HYALB_00003410 [Hymenoscyphus albidus]
MLEKRSRSSRLSRTISLYIPNFKQTPDSKKPQATLKKAPPPNLDLTPPQRDAPPPSRLPPPAPTSPPLQPISSGRLQKPQSPSQKLVVSTNTIPIPPLHPPSEQRRSRRSSSSLLSAVGPGVQHNRSVSSPLNARPQTSNGELTFSKRSSWMNLGRRSQHSSTEDLNSSTSDAWVNAGSHKIDYNLSLLLNGEKVPELWDESADTFIYLFPEATGRGPSFKIPSMVLSSSFVLMDYITAEATTNRSRGRASDENSRVSSEDAVRKLSLHGSIHGQGVEAGSSTGLGTPPYTPKTSARDSPSSRSDSDGIGETLGSLNGLPYIPREIHLYFPTGLTSDGIELSPQEIQILVEIRNLFAFLIGQPLVGTPACPSVFRIFISIGSLLQKYDFTNFDGSTFGEAAAASFDFCLDDMRLADVRTSSEKTLEGIILGESMRCASLYTESFTHAVGKYTSVKEKRLPLFDEISPATLAGLERSSLDLVGRQSSVDQRLIDFEFPSVFAGLAASTTSAESKIVHFKAWKNNFMSMRKFVHSYSKELHGQWPPKAGSKKNSFVVGGLNRLVLKGLYADLCSLYDLKANRTQLTTRSIDSSNDEEVQDGGPEDAALRLLLSEFDRSSPPVAPPIPYDVPLVPSISTVEPRMHQKSEKQQNKLKTRRLKEYETTLILTKARNVDSEHDTPFLNAYRKFEAKESKGRNSVELMDQTYGHWVFIYVVLQSLPLLVVDVSGLRYTEGVEYFLCEAPSSGLPWLEEAPKTAWYGVQGGSQVVALPSYLVENGIEAVYRRSHCWTVAEKWIGNANGDEPEDNYLEPQLSPLAPPPGFGDGFGTRPTSRGRDGSSELSVPGSRDRSSNSKRQSIALGLERLPIPAGQGWSPVGSRASSPATHSRRVSSIPGPPPAATSGATFDQILGTMSSDSVDSKKTKGKK